MDLLLWIIPFGIIGARAYYVLLSWNYYSQNVGEAFGIQNGGLSIHGAILGGLLGGYIFIKKNKLDFFKYADIVAYGLPLAQALGRWGNFFNSEAFGKPADAWWALYIPIEKRPLDYISYSTYHPTFLYEFFADIFIFLLLFFVVRPIFKGKDGGVFFSYLILYSSVRLITEYIRIDSVLNILTIPVASWASIFLIGISVGFLSYIKKKEGI